MRSRDWRSDVCSSDLKEIGGAGQARLLSADVAIIGAGGIGSPAILYLAAAGVGTIRVIDDDAVALSNLQRQVLFGTAEIGAAKAESAMAAVARLNPDVKLIPINARIDAGTAALMTSSEERRGGKEGV